MHPIKFTLGLVLALQLALPALAGTGPAARDSLPAAATSTAADAVGEQKIAVILVSFPSVPLLSSATPALYRNAYFGTGRSVDSFLRESSYGKTWASGQVFGPFVLDGDYFNQPLAVRDAAIRAAAGQVDFTQYKRIVLVVPQSSTGLESGGLGMGSETIRISPTLSINASTAWLGDASSGSVSALLNSACHEMGHNLGLEHARAADFGNETIGPLGQLPAPFDQTRDYGDSFSNMGRGSGHWAAPEKAALGWLQDGADIKTIESNGGATLQAYEAPGSGLKALRIRRGSGNDAWLWLEYRQPSAGIYDADLPATAFGGALIHYEDAGWKDTEVHSNLLRMNADDQRGLFFGNAPLAAGSSWSDPYSNVSISLDKNLANGLQVTVSYAPAAAISVTPAYAHADAIGGQVTFNVSAPAGTAWSATPSVTWMNVTSGTSGVGNGQISVSVAPTTITASRWGKLQVGQAFAVLTQDGMAGNVSIDPAAATFPATGGTGSIAVAANAADYAWNYASNATWIQSVFFSKYSTTGSGNLRYIVAQNTSGAARTGTISVGAKVFTITQAAGGPLVSQLDWQRQPLADAPMSRLSMDMAVFTSRGESILYGGGSDGTLFTDTWAWNGSAWTQKAPVHNPGGQSGHAMAYDAAHDQIILFGGFDSSTASGVSDSTWAWNGNDWTQLHPQTSPGARANHAMAYNPDSGKILLFGGFGGNDVGTDTWEWDGSNWSQKVSTSATAGAPSIRDGAAMAYDPARKEMLLFGGGRDLYSGLQPAFYNDTWAWDGSKWQQRSTGGPTPRISARMEYNPDLGQIVLVGGYGAKDVGTTPPFTYVFDYREETWTWDGSNWTQRFPDKSPEFSYNYGMVYDSVHQGFFTHLGDDLHCADRGPRTYALKPGAGAVLLGSYRAEQPASGGSGSIVVASAVPWTAAPDSWITIGAGAAGNGSGTISYQVAPNTSSAARRGSIKINDKVFTISQQGAAAITGAPGAPTIIAVTAGTGSANISFTAPTEHGSSAITAYTATCSAAGQTTRSAIGTGSPIVVTGLAGGVAYSCSIAASNAAGAGTASAALTATPQAGASLIQFAQARTSVAESAGNVVLTVGRSGDTSGSASVQYATCGSDCSATATAMAGSDFTAAGGTLSFGPGVASLSISIPIINDAATEGNETFTVTLSNPSGATLGTTRSAQVTILDGQVAQLTPAGQLFNLPSPGNSDAAYLRFYNLGSTAIPVAGTLYDQDGKQLGTADLALTAGLAAKGILVLGSSDIAALFGVTSWTGRGWLEVKSTVPSSTLLIQNLVRSTTLTNMSCVSDRVAVNIPMTDNTDQAFVRLYNTGAAAGAVRGTLYDQNGNVLGTPNSVLVSSLGAKAVAALTADVIRSATGAPAWSGRAWLDLTADFGANLKIMNLIRDPSNTLNDMSCAFALNTVGQLYNIAGPGNADSAYLRFYNTGSTAGTVTGTLYDQNGQVLGTAGATLSASLPAKGVLVLGSTDIAALFGATSWTGRAWLEVQSTLPAGALLMQNLSRSNTLTNMSCVSDRVAVNIPMIGNTDQAFVRLYNTGSTAGAVRGTLYDQNGNVLGTPNSVLVSSLAGKAVAALTADQIQSATGAATWSGRAWLDLSADFGSSLKIMNLIRDSSNTLNDMSCAVN